MVIAILFFKKRPATLGEGGLSPLHRPDGFAFIGPYITNQIFDLGKAAVRAMRITLD
jgi:hypothetical protein